MKLRINKLVPPPPPATYDLTGLSQEQMALIFALVGACCEAVADEVLKASGLPVTNNVVKDLYNQMGEYRELTKGNGATYVVKVTTQDDYRRLLYKE